MSERVAEIEHRTVAPAPIDRVWRALTARDEVAAWLGCLQFEPKLGHTFYMQQDGAKRELGDIEGATHCEIVALGEPHHLVFTWFYPDTPKTRVTFELAARGKETQVTLRHTGFDQFPAEVIRAVRDGLDRGWSTGVLPGLVAAVTPA